MLLQLLLLVFPSHIRQPDLITENHWNEWLKPWMILIKVEE